MNFVSCISIQLIINSLLLRLQFVFHLLLLRPFYPCVVVGGHQITIYIIITSTFPHTIFPKKLDILPRLLLLAPLHTRKHTQYCFTTQNTELRISGLGWLHITYIPYLGSVSGTKRRLEASSRNYGGHLGDEIKHQEEIFGENIDFLHSTFFPFDPCTQEHRVSHNRPLGVCCI